MKLNVPFVKNRDWECGQACVAMMIKYFYPDFEPDFKEFNKIIHQKSGKYTHPPQLGILLDAFEVKVKVFSSDYDMYNGNSLLKTLIDYDKCKNGFPYFKGTLEKRPGKSTTRL